LTRPDFDDEPAGIVTRTLAASIDLIVVLVLLIAVWAGVAAALFLARPARFTMPSPPHTLVIVLAIVGAVLYLTVAWATTGRTLGAQLMGLRVLSRRGGRLGWWRSTVRALAYVIFPLGLAWTIVDRRNRSVQDLLFASSVVYDWLPRHPLPQ
jgi:uncharacterized RDD family membrane protein YckC